MTTPDETLRFYLGPQWETAVPGPIVAAERYRLLPAGVAGVDAARRAVIVSTVNAVWRAARRRRGEVVDVLVVLGEGVLRLLPIERRKGSWAAAGAGDVFPLGDVTATADRVLTLSVPVAAGPPVVLQPTWPSPAAARIAAALAVD